MRFSIRDLLFVTTIVALAVGWWLSNQRNAAFVTKLKEDLADGREIKNMELEAKLKVLEVQLISLGYIPTTRRSQVRETEHLLSPKAMRKYRQRTVEQLEREIERLESLMPEKKASGEK